MTVILINRARRMKVFTLAHATYCQAVGSCGCTLVDARTGRRVAQSLTLPAGGRSAQLPEAILQIGDVVRAVVSGELGVERVVPKAKTKPTRTGNSVFEGRRTKTRKGSR